MTVATIAAAAGEETIAFDIFRAQKPVFHALLEARARFGGKRAAVVDGDERVLTYDQLVQGSLAIGHALKRGTERGEAVGVMLPTGTGAVIAYFALTAFGRVPAMLNFTSGAAGMRSALKTAKVKRIVTAHKFVKLAKLEDLIAELSRIGRDRLSRRCAREADAARQGCGGDRPIRALAGGGAATA